MSDERAAGGPRLRGHVKRARAINFILAFSLRHSRISPRHSRESGNPDACSRARRPKSCMNSLSPRHPQFIRPLRPSRSSRLCAIALNPALPSRQSLVSRPRRRFAHGAEFPRSVGDAGVCRSLVRIAFRPVRGVHGGAVRRPYAQLFVGA